jgi:hypothetical protein
MAKKAPALKRQLELLSDPPIRPPEEERMAAWWGPLASLGPQGTPAEEQWRVKWFGPPLSFVRLGYIEWLKERLERIEPKQKLTDAVLQQEIDDYRRTHHQRRPSDNTLVKRLAQRTPPIGVDRSTVNRHRNRLERP